MTRFTRRSFIRMGTGAVAAAAAGWSPTLGADAKEAETAYDFGLAPLGKVKPVPSTAIEASPLSVGFETLDRKHFTPERTYAHLARLGVKWARCQTGWSRCEVARGQFLFGWLDKVVDSLLKAGIQPWFNLGYGNSLYVPKKPSDYSVGWAPIFDEGARDGWVRFTRAIATHFSDRVSHWEIWNEPNIGGFWKPHKPSAADYVRLVKLTAIEIRQRIRGAVIIGGAYAGIPFPYIQQCLQLGMADHVDRISYHPYRPVPEAGYEPQVAKLRKLVARYNKKVKLWQGENGCPSQGGKGSVGALSNLEWTELRQAKWHLRRILSDLRLEVDLTSYFHTVDLVGYRKKTNFKGLLRGADYTPKPAYAAYQCLCALFDAKTTRDPKLTLDLVGHKKVHMLDAGFVRGGRALYAYWYPANLQKGWTPRTLTMRFATPLHATINAPVLVDPLSSQVYPLAKATRGEGSLTIADLPLLDYPLLVTDRATVLPS